MSVATQQRTTFCILCPRRAEVWCGHVRTLDGTEIAAGWCRSHRHPKNRTGFAGIMGYVGEWRREQGSEGWLAS